MKTELDYNILPSHQENQILEEEAAVEARTLKADVVRWVGDELTG